MTLTLPIAPWEAALGATVQTPTLAGPVDLRIPPNAKAGQKMRLKGRGLPGATPGDQYVVLKIVLPPADTPQAREMYEQMQRELPFDPRAEAEVNGAERDIAIRDSVTSWLRVIEQVRDAAQDRHVDVRLLDEVRPRLRASRRPRRARPIPRRAGSPAARSRAARSSRSRSSPDMPGSAMSVIRQPSVSRADGEIALGAVVVLYVGVERAEQ